mgnify:CR=1 FL=1
MTTHPSLPVKQHKCMEFLNHHWLVVHKRCVSLFIICTCTALSNHSFLYSFKEPPIPTVRAKEVRKPLGDITNCPPAADSSFDESEHDLPDDEDWLPSESDDEEEEVAISNDSTVDWKSHLPAELAADADWLHFFLQQVKNCGKYKRWSVT